MVSINRTSSQPYNVNNQKSHSGLKISAGLTTIAAASLIGAPKLVNCATGSVAKTSKKQIAGLNQIIKETKNTIKESAESGTLTENASILGKNLIDETSKLKENIYKSVSSMFETRKMFKKINLKKSFAIATPFYLGAGAIVDYMNNKQRAKSEPNAKTKKGNEYVKVDMGKKLGGFLGLACEGGMLALNKTFNNCPKVKNPLSTIVISALGGFLLGAVADKLSNKKAAKAADKNA